MSIEDKLRELILSRYKSLREFVQHTDLTYSTVNSILHRGIANSSLTNILKLCNALGISADELANNKIVSNEVVQKRSHMTDISGIMQIAKMNLTEHDRLTLEDNPVNAEDVQLLADAIDVGIELVRKRIERRKHNEI